MQQRRNKSAVSHYKIVNEIEGKTVVKTIVVPKRLVNIVVKQIEKGQDIPLAF